MESREAEVRTSCISPITFLDQGKLHGIPVPLARIFTCGMVIIEVLKEVISGDPPHGRYEVVPTQTLRGRGAVPSLTLLKLLIGQAHRFSTSDWLATHMKQEMEVGALVSLHTPASYLRGTLCQLEADQQGIAALRLLLVQYLRNGRGSGPGYQLAAYPLIWLDTDALAYHVEHAALMERMGEPALALPFWERACALASRGVYLPDEPSSEWAEDMRGKVEGCLRQSVHALSRLYLAEYGNAGEEEAMLRLRTYWQQYPTDEDALRALMELLGSQERYQEALEAYKQTQGVLAQDGHEPDARTQDIAAYIQTKQISRAPKPVSSALSQGIRLNGPSLAVPSLTHMVQLAQTQHTALPETVSGEQGTFVPSESGVLVPLTLSMQTLSLATASVDVATWFGARVNDLKAIGAFWHGPMVTCQQQQAHIHAEIEKWNAMTDQNNHAMGEYHITRRMALATLATLSSSLLARVQFGPLTTFVIEEFLTQCATSITACYHLLTGDGLATVEATLPKYLPVLISLAEQPSSYQRRAAYLAAQGCWVMGLVALHRLLFKERVAYGKQSVEFARLSGDHTLLVMMQASLGNAWYNVGQQAEMEQKQQEAATAYAQMLQMYQEAAHTIAEAPHDVPSILHSKVFAGLAHACAQHALVQEALRWIGEARAVFFEGQEDLPGFLSTDYGIYQVVLFEGLTFLDLGKYDSDKDHDEQAWNKLEQIELFDATIKVPERFRIEIVNQRALAAVRTGKLEEFLTYLTRGVQGAKYLQSQKRRQEAITNWKAARDLWPHEKRVMELADVLF